MCFKHGKIFSEKGMSAIIVFEHTIKIERVNYFPIWIAWELLISPTQKRKKRASERQLLKQGGQKDSQTLKRQTKKSMPCNYNLQPSTGESMKKENSM